MKHKKLTAFFLALLLFLCTGCKNEKADIDASSSNASGLSIKASEQINMLYSSKDNFNPFTCKTNQNRVLTQLMYDSLIVLDNNYEPIYNIAESAEYKDKQLTVKLRTVRFSNGATVTAQDIVFSYETAKKFSSSYATSLKYAASATALDNHTVTFKLFRDDPFFINLLTFPIIKYGSDTLKDSDNRELPPIGSGRYVLDIDKKQLFKNTFYTDGNFSIKTINLVDAPDSESVNQTVSTGAIDYFYTDLSDNTIPKMNGTSVDVPQSRLVFLGINPESPRLSNTYFRQAVSSALDRTEICSSAYFSKASPAKGPFPSNWKASENYQTIEVLPNSATFENNISEAGFNKKDEDGYYLQKNGNPISLTLLVSSENSCRYNAAEQIKKNLEDVGIKVNLKAVNEAKFKSLLSTKSYDMYLSEIRFENNMDLGGLVNLNSASALTTAPSTSGIASFNASYSGATSRQNTGSTSSAVASSTSSPASNSTNEAPVITLTTKEAYNGYYSGIYTVQDIITAFTAELPVIPVCFRSGLVIYSEKLGTGTTPIISDLFYKIEKIK